MADFGIDSAVAKEDGRYVATIAKGWEIWGPQGGYIAAIALRAAAAASSFRRPASIACHYLRPAEVGPTEVRVESLRQSRRAESLRVTLFQNEASIVDALVWTVAELVGVDHDAATAPDVPPPEELESWDAYWPDDAPPFQFWRNFDIHPVTPHPSEWSRATDPEWIVWSRLRVRPPLDDPYVDAARMLLAADSAMYPAATFAHDVAFPYIAPSMDLTMSFHVFDADSEWLLIDAVSPLAASSLVAGKASIWSSDGRLLASAMQQMLQRP